MLCAGAIENGILFMTLIIAGGNNDHCFLSADRRLSGNGEIFDDETNKITVLGCNDTKCSIAFTGLANYTYKGKSFYTLSWLYDTIDKICNRNSDFDNLIEELAVEANNEIGKINFLDKNHKALTFVIIGYQYRDGKKVLKLIKISNFEEGGDFENFKIIDLTNESLEINYTIAGYTKPVTDNDLEGLIKLLKNNKPVKYLENYCINKIAEISGRTTAKGLIGPQINCVNILSKIPSKITHTYYSSTLTSICYGAIGFLYFKEQALIKSYGSELYTGIEPAIVPKVKKNHKCLCGKGLKYKDCHGRFRYPYLPMTFQVEFTPEAEAFPIWGNFFTVESIGASQL